jgi:hypothetical protein
MTSTAPALPPKLDLAAVLSRLAEDGFFTVAGSARLDADALRAMAAKRLPVLVSAARGAPTPGIDAWDPWVLGLCAALAPIAPPRWIPLADAIEAGLSLEHGARGVRSLFTSKPSEKDVARVRQLGGVAVRAITSVLAAAGPPTAEAALLRGALLASLGLPDAERAGLEAEPPVHPEALDLHGDLDAKLARSIVRGGFYAARVDGTDPREEQVVITIARKLGLTTDEVNQAREEARALIDSGKDFGEACVDAIRWLLEGDGGESDRFAVTAARLTLSPIQRHDAITAVNVGSPVILGRRHRLDRRQREAALALAWLAAVHANPTYLRRAELVGGTTSSPPTSARRRTASRSARRSTAGSSSSSGRSPWPPRRERRRSRGPMSRRPALLAAAVLSTACAPIPELTALPPATPAGYAGYSSPKYADGRQWLCRPDLPADHCRIDLTTTEIHPDLSRTVVPHVPAAAPQVDCFYVYPTVDLSPFPGNHTELDDLEPMSGTTAAQAARLTGVCDMYVPLYRQVTIGTYLFGEEQRERRLAVAFSDVADAFAHYLSRYNRGRRIALVGHSQGAEMVVRLLRRYFEGDPALRSRLLVALPVGGVVDVPKGRLTGGTFTSIPVCSRPDELGCVVAFHTHREGSEVSSKGWGPRPGNEAVCVNPASVEHNERRWFSGTYFPSTGRAQRLISGIEGVTTPFVLFRQLYAGRCVDGPNGYRYLAVDEARAPGDQRRSPIDLQSFALNTGMGMHILDFQFPQADIVDMVARRAAAARE